MIPNRQTIQSKTVQGVLVLNVMVPRLEGDQTVQQLRDELLAVMSQSGGQKVTLNLRAVQSISSATFWPLLALNKKVRAGGGRLVLCGVSGVLAEAMRHTGMINTEGSGAPFSVQRDVPFAVSDLLLNRPEDQRSRLFPLSFESLFTLPLSDMICVAGFDGYFKLLNGAWQEQLGHPLEDLLDRPYLEFIHPDDRGRTNQEAAGIASGERAVDFENRYRCKDGSYRWLSWNAVPLPQGELIYAVARDVTRRKAGQVVTRHLAESFSLGDAAPKILREVCTSFNWDMGLLWAEDRQARVLRCSAVWPADKFQEFEELSRKTAFRTGVGLPGRVWGSGEPVSVLDVTLDDNFPRGAKAAEEGLRGAFGFPIRLGDDVLGVMEFFSRGTRPPDTELCEIMGAIGSQIGMFIKRVRVEELEREMDAARKVQQSFFPEAAPQGTCFDIAGASTPAKTVGGDYFDYFTLDDGGIAVLVGDVSGKGLGPALVASQARAYLRALTPEQADVGEILTRLNRVLATDAEKIAGATNFAEVLFMTMFLARLDPGSKSFTYADAGHGMCYLLRGAESVRLDSGSPPLCLLPTGMRVPSMPAEQLEPGDILLLLTDGITDAKSSGDEAFGPDRTLECVRLHRGKSAREIIDALFQEISDFSQNQAQYDDTTVVVVKVRDDF